MATSQFTPSSHLLLFASVQTLGLKQIPSRGAIIDTPSGNRGRVISITPRVDDDGCPMSHEHWILGVSLEQGDAAPAPAGSLQIGRSWFDFPTNGRGS